MARITVIIPVHKVEAYLRHCFDSVLAQPFTDFNYVLVDDGLPDNCALICDEYAQMDNRVLVIHHRMNLGPSATRNSGLDWVLKHSNSEMITFIDSDYRVHPLYLETLYNAAQNHSISIC